jgi:hypothetical protein
MGEKFAKQNRADGYLALAMQRSAQPKVPVLVGQA